MFRLKKLLDKEIDGVYEIGYCGLFHKIETKSKNPNETNGHSMNASAFFTFEFLKSKESEFDNDVEMNGRKGHSASIPYKMG